MKWAGAPTLLVLFGCDGVGVDAGNVLTEIAVVLAWGGHKDGSG